MTPLHERVAQIFRDHPDLSVGRLAKIAGVSSSAVSHTKSMDAKAAARLHAYYHYELQWLIEGKGPRMRRVPDKSHSNHGVTVGSAAQNDGLRIVPVVGVMYMTATGAVERFSEEEGTPGGIRVHSTDPNACAIRLMGESVGIFRAGWYVLIEPSAEMVPGEPVLVTLHSGKRLLGELLSNTPQGISLLGLSGTRLAFLQRDVQAVHAVSAVISPSKYVP
jgi:hypothetical protein